VRGVLSVNLEKEEVIRLALKEKLVSQDMMVGKVHKDHEDQWDRKVTGEPRDYKE